MRITTSDAWLLSSEPDEMLAVLRRKAKPSARKLRLFSVAACRCLDAFFDEHARQALDVAEQFADGLASLEELTAVHHTALVPNRPRPPRRTFAERQAAAREIAIISHGWDSIEGATRVDQAVPSRVTFAAKICELVPPDSPRGVAFDPVVLSKMFRDVFVNPFRPVPFNAAWTTQTVSNLAQTIYEEHAFDRLPILADALEEGGCTDADFLAHCRGDGIHVRGCWVVDLILGKS